MYSHEDFSTQKVLTSSDSVKVNDDLICQLCMAKSRFSLNREKISFSIQALQDYSPAEIKPKNKKHLSQELTAERSLAMYRGGMCLQTAARF